MRIELPYRLDRHQINKLTSLVVNDEKEPISKELEFDFSRLSFIEPAGIATLGNLIEWLFKKNTKVMIIRPELFGVKKHCPIKYLDDSGFFKRYLGNKLSDDSGPRPTTKPLQNVTYSDSYQWLESDFIPWLGNQLSVKYSTLGNMEMCLGEIFNNIKDHSTENIGCIYAQHYPNKNKLTFSIADFGIGIPKNIRKINESLSDSEALEMAIREGVTTKTSPRNLGAGLHTLITNVVNDTNGTVHIHSGYGILSVTSGKDEINVSSKLADGYYPGTFIEVVLDTSIIIEEDKLEEQEEFIW